MKRLKWLSVVLVLAVSMAFVFAGPQVKEKIEEKEKIHLSCIEALSGLQALEDLDLALNLGGLESLNILNDLDLSLNMEGLEAALESLEILKDMDFQFEFENFNLDFDDFNFAWDAFDFDFDLDWLDEYDWEWDADADELDKESSKQGLKKIEKVKK